MRPATPRQANLRLRQERIQRNWRQHDLAEQLGTTELTIQRWERGSHQPSAYFRVKLCALFGKSAEELGLLPTSTEYLRPAAEGHPDQRGAMYAMRSLEGLQFWNIPAPRNRFFTGREDLLELLHTRLHPDQTTALPQACAIWNLGGMGKTQVAIEYAYRYARDYQAVFWLDAENDESLMAGVQQIADLLELPERQARDHAQVVVAVQRWLAKSSEWLLIGDNLENGDLLQTLLPPLHQGALLFTTRHPTCGPLAEPIELPPMTSEEGITFLLRRSRRPLAPSDQAQAPESCFIDSERSAAAEVVKLLEGLPLALDQAGAYIEETGCGVANYLQHCLHQRKQVLARRGIHRGAHPASVTTTLMLSMGHTEHSHPAAGALLQICAFLHPEAIPEEVFVAGASHLGPVLGPVAADPYRFDLALAALRSASLIMRDPETQTLSIHRLVQAVLQDQMEPAQARLWGERVIRIVNAAFPEVTHEAWKPCERLLPHALTCATLVPDAECDPELAEMLRKAGEYLYQRGQYKQAESLLQRVLCIQEQMFGPEHPQRAHTLYSLGLLSREQGKRDQAEALLQHALSIREQALGANHLEVARSLNALADLYRQQEQHEQAESLYLRALQIRAQAPGGTSAEVAVTLGNLATLYRDQGKYEQAEPLYKQALRLLEQALGAEHPDSARLLNNLALLYYHQGNYAQAEPLYQRAVHIRERVLGPDHPDVTRPLNNLALLYYHQGNYAQAESLYQRILRSLEQTLGPDHPNTASALNGLATLYHDQGKHEQAEHFYHRALQVREQALGSSHSALSHPLYNLGQLYREQRKYAQAKPFLQRALSVVEQALGPEHPDVAFPLDGLANLYRDQGQYDQAEECYQRALHLREYHLGPEHPRTAETLCNLGTLWLKQERYEQAEMLFQRALAVMEQALGPEHPDVILPLFGLANLCRHQHQEEQAEAYYQRALAASRARLGPAHPQTVEIQTEYQHFLSQGKQASEKLPDAQQEHTPILRPGIHPHRDPHMPWQKHGKLYKGR